MKKKMIAICGIGAICLFALGIQVQAATQETKEITDLSTSLYEEETYSQPHCSQGHVNCQEHHENCEDEMHRYMHNENCDGTRQQRALQTHAHHDKGNAHHGAHHGW